MDDQVLLLTEIVTEKDLEGLKTVGGIEGVASILKSSLVDGIKDSNEEIAWRRKVFGTDMIEYPHLSSFVWTVFSEWRIKFLIACIFFYIFLGIYDKEKMKEGGCLLVAGSLCVASVSISKYLISKLLVKLSNTIQSAEISVVRGGNRQQIRMYEIVVGDVVYLSLGDTIPGHGLLIENRKLKTKKIRRFVEKEDSDIELELMTNHPFVVSGDKVIKGDGRMIVVSVGLNAKKFKQKSLHTHVEIQLERLGKLVTCASVFLAVLFLMVGMVMNYMRRELQVVKSLGEVLRSKGFTTFLGEVLRLKGFTTFLNALGLFLAVCNVPDPWLLSLILSRYYCIKKLMLDRIFVLRPSALDVMAYADVICIDENAVLTMKVTEIWMPAGKEYLEAESLVKEFFQEGVALYTSARSNNFTGSEDETDKALASWAITDLKIDDRILGRHDITAAHSFRKIYYTRATRKADNKVQVHWKGPAQSILEMCSSYYDAFGVVKSITENQRSDFKNIIKGMEENSLGCIAFAHKSLAEKPEKVHEKLILLGVVSFSKPSHSAVRDSLGAGVIVTKVLADGDILITDEDFTAVPKLLQVGKCILSNVQTCIQFHLAANLSSLIVSFIWGLSIKDAPLTAAQFLWVGFFTSTLGASAFAMEKTEEAGFSKKPTREIYCLLTKLTMTKILFQTIYQIIILVVLNRRVGPHSITNTTVIFNSFFFCQLFNIFNARSLEKYGGFQGLKNKSFIGVIMFAVTFQVLLIEGFNKLADTEELSWYQWALCIVIGFGTLPVDWFCTLFFSD